jgi:GntR family transcriptional regulator
MQAGEMTAKTAAPGRAKRPRAQYLHTQEALSVLLQHTAPGTYLPSEPELARQMKISRATLREAMRTFEERGLIVRRQGVGTYVMPEPAVLDTGLEVLESIESMATRNGLKVDKGALIITQRLPEEGEAARFGVQPDEPIVEVSRVVLVDGRTVAFLIDLLPARLLPEEAMKVRFRGSVLDVLMRRADPTPELSRTEITAVSAPADVARHLNIQRGDVLLHMEADLYSKDARLLDHSHSYFLPGTFRFHVVRRVVRRP